MAADRLRERTLSVTTLAADEFHAPSLDDFFPPSVLIHAGPFELDRLMLIRLLMSVLVAAFFVIAMRSPRLVPRGMQNAAELALDFVRINIAEEILGKAMDELAPPVRGMFEAIREACKAKGDELKIKPADVQLTRREIRETTAWSDWQVRMYCQKLVEMEYLFAVQAMNGKPAVYQLARDEESRTNTLRGLTSIDELKKRLTSATKEKAANVG